MVLFDSRKIPECLQAQKELILRTCVAGSQLIPVVPGTNLVLGTQNIQAQRIALKM